MLSTHGVLKDIRNECWNEVYEFSAVSNGIRIVTIELKYPIPSYLTVNDCKVLLTYEGQAKYCFYCKETSHLQIDCPNRRNRPVLHVRQQTYSTVLGESDGSSKLSNTTDMETSVPSPEYPAISEAFHNRPHSTNTYSIAEVTQPSDNVAETSLTTLHSNEEGTVTSRSDSTGKGHTSRQHSSLCSSQILLRLNVPIFSL